MSLLYIYFWRDSIIPLDCICMSLVHSCTSCTSSSHWNCHGTLQVHGTKWMVSIKSLYIEWLLFVMCMTRDRHSRVDENSLHNSSCCAFSFLQIILYKWYDVIVRHWYFISIMCSWLIGLVCYTLRINQTTSLELSVTPSVLSRRYV